MTLSAKSSLIHAVVAANNVEEEHLRAIGWFATYGSRGGEHPSVPAHVLQAQAARYEAASLRVAYVVA